MDAAELIEVHYEPLDAVVDPETSLDCDVLLFERVNCLDNSVTPQFCSPAGVDACKSIKCCKIKDFIYLQTHKQPVDKEKDQGEDKQS